MKLYFECNMGASGNMLMAALYELLPDKSLFRIEMERLGLSGVSIEYSVSTKCGVSGTHISVKVDEKEDISDDLHSGCSHADGVHNYHDLYEHRHQNIHNHQYDDQQHNDDFQQYSHNRYKGRRYGYEEILKLIRGLELPKKVKEDAVCVYKIIGKAEANVHGTPLDEIHFHEVGSIDAVVDIVGCCLLMDMLGVTDITVSPVHVGFGMVRCEHGILPVPTPATAEILKGIPIYSGHIEGELCTPTGAALLKHFAVRFESMPQMDVLKIGYGMGTKDFSAANCFRAFLYEDLADGHTPDDDSQDIVFEISCNLDDMTPEAVGAAFEVLFDNGALDVFATPIIMKKNRQSVMLSCLCSEDTRDFLAEIIFRHTMTLGVRIAKCYRKVMERTVETVHTEYGSIRVKRAKGFGEVKLKPEYDDVQAAVKKHGVSFQTVFDAAMCAAYHK